MGRIGKVRQIRFQHIRFQRIKQFALGLVVGLCWALPATAQSVTPTVGAGNVGTQVSGTNAFTVTGGNQQLSTLFHSFESFSPASADVLFQLDSSQRSVEYVIGRITGERLSFIDGQLSLIGGNSPDLFLINPNGITFGSRASLSLPGSFTASSADSILFKNALAFSANTPTAAPLLTVSQPIGLQFKAGRSAPIVIEGSGHAVSSANPIFLPYSGGGSGLGVSEAETLALIGGSVRLAGGIVTAPGGHAELGGITEGTVGLQWQPQGFTADYTQVQQFGTIDLLQQSLVDVSGTLGLATAAGSSRIQGSRIALSDGSLVWSQNRGGPRSSGDISLWASETISIGGATPTVSAVSGIVAETVLTAGTAGSINVTAPNLIVHDGATIFSRSFGMGASGDVTIEANQAEVSGGVPIVPDVFTLVGTTGSVAGNAGDVTATVQTLSISDGGFVGSSTLGSGRGGDVWVSADDIRVVGTSSNGLSSILSSTTAGRMGNAGNIQIDTRSLAVQAGGNITSSSVGVGNAGNVSIRASERIEVIGNSREGIPSLISSTVDFPPPAYAALLGLSGTPRGSAGSVTISTPLLSASNEGGITVINRGQGNGGEISIEADNVRIDDGFIDAFTADGDGGNTSLQVGELLLARSSTIKASSFGETGNGGNVFISSPIVLGVDNSDVFANAVQGSGGNISINTQRLLGFEFREQLTSESDITASSEFGADGVVAINNLTIDPSSGLVELPEGLADSSSEVAKGCSSKNRNTFVLSGRGGVPISPTMSINSNRFWADIRSLSSAGVSELDAATTTDSLTTIEAAIKPEMVEASGWQIAQDGRIELAVATPATESSVFSTSCLLHS